MLSALASSLLAAPSLPKYDAALILGGGIDEAGQPLDWVKARLDMALDMSDDVSYFLTLSRGTTHEPPPLDSNAFPVDEATASEKYLLERGVAPERIIKDTWSLDTIGNAAFARLMHAEPRQWQRMAVITSDWHMNRSKAIFEWVFKMPPRPTPMFIMDYVESPGMIPADVLDARLAREAESLEGLKVTMAQVPDLPHLHQYIFVNHSAYAAGAESFDANEDKSVAASYKGGSSPKRRAATLAALTPQPDALSALDRLRLAPALAWRHEAGEMAQAILAHPMWPTDRERAKRLMAVM